jgi:diguanylate cyclase (GGDEF)-like protein
MASQPAYPIPADEEQRLRDLERHGVLGVSDDEHFERILDLAGSILEAPIVLISLVDAQRQRILAGHGLAAREVPREVAFCAHTIAGDDVLVVPDASLDERFRANPLVLGEPHIRFYAGAPLRSPEGHNLGTLCVIDHRPRQPAVGQIRQLSLMADLVMRELELRRLADLCPVTGLPSRHTFLAIGEREVERARQESHALSLLCFDIDDFRRINRRWGHHAGDGVLRDLGRLVGSFLREEDFAGRLGDGEFGLLLVGRDRNEALSVAEGLRREVPRMAGVHAHSDVRLHISGGLTSMGKDDRTFTDLLQRADRALELAKGNGRDQIACLFEGS